MLNSLGVLLQGLPAAPAQQAHIATRGPTADPSIYERNLRFLQQNVLPPGWRMNAVQVCRTLPAPAPAPRTLLGAAESLHCLTNVPDRPCLSHCRSGMRMVMASASSLLQRRLLASAACLFCTTGRRVQPPRAVGRRCAKACFLHDRAERTGRLRSLPSLCVLR